MKRNVYTREVDWPGTMLNVGTWIVAPAIMWGVIIFVAWRAWKGPWSG